MYIEDDPYPALRQAVAAQYRDLPPENLEELFDDAGLAAESMELSLREVGRFAGSMAPALLPAAGTVVGTAVGGPLGGALGGALGAAAGGAIGRAGRGGTRPAPTRPPPAAHPPATAGGSPAAAQLLAVLNRPEVMQALIAMALGPAGNRTVPVGHTPVPVGAFGNLIGTLAGTAVAEHHVVVAGNGGGVPEYLLDESGTPAVDPHSPRERAGRLLQLLHESTPVDDPAGDEPVPDELDDLWDDFERLDLDDD